MADDSPYPLHSLQALVDAAVPRLRAARTDLESVEAKEAAGGLPFSAVESVCAFSNSRGGLILLGLAESGFTPARIDAAKLAADLASACADALEPSISPEIDIVLVDGRPVVAARVSALAHDLRPCYVIRHGLQRGAFRRSHDGDRRMNTYEVHVMLAGRGQPRDDATPVEGSSLGDLDPVRTGDLLARLRSRRGPSFEQAEDAEVLRMAGVVTEASPDSELTLAGLLALGRYPQQFHPQLAASFVALPTMSGEPTADGTRFIDNRVLDGPIPEMVSDALRALRSNMRTRSVIVGAGREDVWDYPEAAVREVVANALMHRDYHPTAQGSQVRIELYPDRLEVASIGGLHGPLAGSRDIDDLIAFSTTTTRNAHLARLLEDVTITGSGRPVCENRGSGLRAASAALRRASMPPLQILDEVHSTRAVMRRRSHQPGDPEEPLLADGGPAGTAPGFCSAMDSGRPAISDAAGIQRYSTSGRPASDREREIIELLSAGPRRSSDLAAALGISRQATLRWLGRMRCEGLVRSTEASPRNRRNRWQLTQIVQE